MKVVPVRSVRFAKLVESYGHPSSKTLWVDPQSDPELKKAVKQNRVLTVAQSNTGTKKDIGLIGFFPEKRGAFLLFPKELAYSPGTKVIGIKWDMIVEAAPQDPVNWKRLSQKAAKPSLKAAAPPAVPDPVKPAQKRASTPAPKPLLNFQVVLEISARQEIAAQVEADTPKEARSKAAALEPVPNWGKAEIIYKIKKITQTR